ncbi:MAG: cysteine dioxygenase family protein [Proteobacteria bacterium]|nr:cysteine dioxygenase family protein [Pseudomonadota bacterium]
MTEINYSVAEYVEDLRRITAEETDEKAIFQRLAPLAQKLATTPGWITDKHRHCDKAQGFGFHTLHEEDDHTNAVFLLSWLPDRGTPAHDHGTWAVVAGIEGEEKETMWTRVDDASTPGHAELTKGTEAIMTAGKVSCLPSGDIHAVWNVADEISMSLHTYGKHVNFTDRSQFDPEAKTASPYIVTVD